MVSQHPRVEDRLVRELDDLELLATPERPQPRPLTPSDLGKLPYLSCVIKVPRSPQCSTTNKQFDSKESFCIMLIGKMLPCLA